MSYSKKQAFKSLSNQIRKKYGFDYERSEILSEGQIFEIAKSDEEILQKFAEISEGKIPTKGGHPDYDYLSTNGYIGKTESGRITAFFFDLKNFTKYYRLLDNKEKVYKAKAASIEAIIQVCYLYGGHLHEIPGDGVLIFFGGRDSDHYITAYQALMAITDAMVILEDQIIPEYNTDQYPDIYPKMGIDFGDATWGAYGASPLYETKATSFNVDIASKMMKWCNSKDIAIGDDFRKHLELDPKYLEKISESYRKILTIKGQERKIDYSFWRFDWKNFKKDKMDDEVDLKNISTYPQTTSPLTSKTKLKDAPLA